MSSPVGTTDTMAAPATAAAASTAAADSTMTSPFANPEGSSDVALPSVEARHLAQTQQHTWQDFSAHTTGFEFISQIESIDAETKSQIHTLRIVENKHSLAELGYDFHFLKLRQLKTLAIENATVNEESLSRFFTAHRRTLEHVIIKNVAIPRSSPDRAGARAAWLRVLNALNNCRRLRSLTILEIAYQGHSDPQGKPAGSPEFAREYLKLPQAKYAMRCVGSTNDQGAMYRLQKDGVRARYSFGDRYTMDELGKYCFNARSVVKEALLSFQVELRKAGDADPVLQSEPSRPIARVPYRRPR